MAASYDPTAAVVLTFDRAIDIAGIDGAAVVVNDGVNGLQFAGTNGVTLVGPAAVEVVLAGLGEWLDPGVTLTVSPANGIVAAGDGAAFAGVTDVGLPFP